MTTGLAYTLFGLVALGLPPGESLRGKVQAIQATYRLRALPHPTKEQVKELNESYHAALEEVLNVAILRPVEELDVEELVVLISLAEGVRRHEKVRSAIRFARKTFVEDVRFVAPEIRASLATRKFKQAERQLLEAKRQFPHRSELEALHTNFVEAYRGEERPHDALRHFPPMFAHQLLWLRQTPELVSVLHIALEVLAELGRDSTSRAMVDEAYSQCLRAAALELETPDLKRKHTDKEIAHSSALLSVVSYAHRNYRQIELGAVHARWLDVLSTELERKNAIDGVISKCFGDAASQIARESCHWRETNTMEFAIKRLTHRVMAVDVAQDVKLHLLTNLSQLSLLVALRTRHLALIGTACPELPKSHESQHVGQQLVESPRGHVIGFYSPDVRASGLPLLQIGAFSEQFPHLSFVIVFVMPKAATGPDVTGVDRKAVLSKLLKEVGKTSNRSRPGKPATKKLVFSRTAKLATPEACRWNSRKM